MDSTKIHITLDDFPFYKSKRVMYNDEHKCKYEIRCSEGLENLSDDTPIYKYLKLPYLLELLTTKNLYIARRDIFSDRRDAKGDKIQLSEYINTFDFAKRLTKKEMKSKELKSKFIWNQFISCWTLNINSEREFFENYLLWKNYDSRDIVCRIGTTINKLIFSISKLSNDMILSPIQYEPYDKKHIDSLYWKTFVKADFYKGENEIRLLVLSNSKTNSLDRFILIPVNIENLLTEVAISPFISRLTQDFISDQLLMKYPFLNGKITKTPIIEY